MKNTTRMGLTSYQATNASINAVAKRYRYTGKERDEESGLYYYSARYYIPWLCRWTAIDPLAEKFPAWNPYHYVHQNPINLIDPTGMSAYPPTEEEYGNLGIDIGNIQDGYEWRDSDGNWAFNSQTNSWEGIDGTMVNIPAQTQQIEGIEVTNLNWFQRNFVFNLSFSGSVGTQIGLKAGVIEGGAGLVSTEIGTVNLDLTRMNFNKSSWGDGSIHNYANFMVGIKKTPIALGGGVDYSYSSLEAMYGDGLFENGHFDPYFKAGAKAGRDLFKGYEALNIAPAVTTENFKGIQFGIGAKVIFGVEVNIKLGLKK